nr:hypothetical protein [Tanacetum cinerariifolium]
LFPLAPDVYVLKVPTVKEVCLPSIDCKVALPLLMVACCLRVSQLIIGSGIPRSDNSSQERHHVLMIDYVSIIETDKVIHTAKTDMVKLAIEIESFFMSADKFDKETRTSDGLQPKQANLIPTVKEVCLPSIDCKTDMVKLAIEIESFFMSADKFDKETRTSDGLQPKQANLSCVHALNEPHFHEIHVVP